MHPDMAFSSFPAPEPDEPRLRICNLAACPFPANHGTPGSIREMAEAVAQRGHEVHIVTYHFGEDIPVQGPTLHRIPALVREKAIFVGPTARRPLYDLMLAFETFRVVNRYRPDLVHAHGYEAALAAALVRMATGVPFLYSGHNRMGDELPSYQFIRPAWLGRSVARTLDVVVPRLADRCLPHSANLRDFFHQLGLRRRTEPVVPFGIDLETVDPQSGAGARVSQRYGLGPGPVLGYGGVLDEFQRIDLLLEAARPALLQFPEARLLMIRTIPHEKHLARVRRLASELGLAGRVVFTEPQTLAGVRECLAACDVAVLSRPRVPGFPIKLLNYLAMGRACALFASSANGLTHGVNAFLAHEDTSQSLGEAIIQLLKDKDLRGRLARNGLDYVRTHHDRREMARQVCQAYLRTLRETGRARRLEGRECAGVGSQGSKVSEGLRVGTATPRAANLL